MGAILGARGCDAALPTRQTLETLRATLAQQVGPEWVVAAMQTSARLCEQVSWSCVCAAVQHAAHLCWGAGMLTSTCFLLLCTALH